MVGQSRESRIRPAASSRQRRLAGVGVLAAVLLAMMTACGGDAPQVSNAPATTATSAQSPSSTAPALEESTSSSSSAPSSSSSSTDAAGAAPKSYAAGQCLGNKPDYAPVACDSPHGYEVTAVIQSTAHTGDLVKRPAYGTAACNLKTADYLGSQGWPVTRIQGITLPTSADPQNAKRFVCLAYELEPNLDQQRMGSGSLKGKLTGDSFYSYSMCLKGRASSSDDVDFVPCSEPHASEATGGKINGKPDDPFPTGDTVQTNALKFCRPLGYAFLGSTSRKDVVASQNSGGATPWSKGNMITGCFVEVTSGTVGKSIRGIGSKPLSSYR